MVKSTVPEFGVSIEPVACRGKCFAVDGAIPGPALLATQDQRRLFKHLDVLGGIGQRHVEGRGELADGAFSASEGEQHLPTGRIGECVKHLVQLSLLKFNHVVEYMGRLLQKSTS